jgi:hypothetical protein
VTSPYVGRSAVLVSACLCAMWTGIAPGQSLTGRFFPKKQTYLVGEPVFVDFEIVNSGEQSAGIESRMGEPCTGLDSIEVVRADTTGLDGNLTSDASTE